MNVVVALAAVHLIAFEAAPRDTRCGSRKAEAEAIRRGHFFMSRPSGAQTFGQLEARSHLQSQAQDDLFQARAELARALSAQEVLQPLDPTARQKVEAAREHLRQALELARRLETL